jgi:hypothetical protein
MGTYAGCLPLLIHNLERYVADLILTTPLDQVVLELSLKQKIDLLRGIPIRANKRTFQTTAVISAELWELLEDLREQRNSSVHVAGYLYHKIMQFTGLYLSYFLFFFFFLVLKHKGFSFSVNNKSIKFSNSDSTLKIDIPHASTHAAVVGTHGIQINNYPLEETQVELGTESDHHFILQVWTKKLFKENCARLYNGEVPNDFVLVYYYGKSCSVYVDLKKSHIDKIRDMFSISVRHMPFCLYFKFNTDYFLAKLI